MGSDGSAEIGGISYGIIELSFVFGIVLALLFYELIKTRRELLRSREAKRLKADDHNHKS